MHGISSREPLVPQKGLIESVLTRGVYSFGRRMEDANSDSNGASTSGWATIRPGSSSNRFVLGVPNANAEDDEFGAEPSEVSGTEASGAAALRLPASRPRYSMKEGGAAAGEHV
jgi:hypothetical protein